MMGEKQQNLIQIVDESISSHRQILVGLSGGLDSTVLLHCLVRLREQYYPDLVLRAVHVHHGLSIYADEWAMQCEQLCLQWNVPFICRKVVVDSHKKGIEGAARNVRYDAYRDTVFASEVIATAQHLNDQAETFLLALKRGSGPKGLSSMPEKQPFLTTENEHTFLIRPLLTVTRHSLEQYANFQSLSWVMDESNQNDRYDRNFLRLQVLPTLTARWPHFSHSVARSATLCAQQEQLLDELLDELLNELVDYQGTLHIDGMVGCSDIKRNALLRRWLALHQLPMPSYAQLHHIWHEVALARVDAEPIYQLGDYDIRRYQGYLCVVRRIPSLLGQRYDWDYPLPFVLPEDLGELITTQEEGQVRVPKKEEKVTIAFGLSGTVSIVGRERSRQSKKLWQELGVAPWLRERTPLVYYNETLIMAVGCFVTKQGLAGDDEPAVGIHWYSP